VDAGQGCVRRQFQPDQYLRPKSLQVLLYLLAHRDRTVTKDELMAHVWEGLSVTDDVLVGCVGEVRRALGDEPRGKRFIRTLPKIGYRFVAPVNEIRPGVVTKPELAPRISAEELKVPVRGKSRGAPWIVFLGLLALPVVLALIPAWRPRVGKTEATHKEEVAWWKLDEAAGSVIKDFSGNNNTGALQGRVQSDGMAGRGLRFDGANTHISGIGPSRGLPAGSAPRTVTTWIRTSSTNGDTTSIFYYGRNELIAGASYGLSLLLLEVYCTPGVDDQTSSPVFLSNA